MLLRWAANGMLPNQSRMTAGDIALKCLTTQSCRGVAPGTVAVLHSRDSSAEAAQKMGNCKDLREDLFSNAPQRWAHEM